MSSSPSSSPSTTRTVQFLHGTLSVTFSPLTATDVDIVFDPHPDVIRTLTTDVTFSHFAQDSFGTIFSSAVFSTATTVVSSDILPICSFAPSQSLPSLSSLIFPLLPLPPLSSLTPTRQSSQLPSLPPPAFLHFNTAAIQSLLITCFIRDVSVVCWTQHVLTVLQPTYRYWCVCLYVVQVLTSYSEPFASLYTFISVSIFQSSVRAALHV